ncbi:MAG TPA: phospholipid carrier-dependent glycosyltransferase [Deltaproteobacteria bacterium]|nr:phospholipid carrier-dependent glycosyltransferase [Deltaproteobacteria bacterium]
MKALPLSFILAFSAALTLTGIDWGLPSAQRSALYYTDPASEAAGNPGSPALRSYHPDEHKFLMAIANMEPGELDFNPRFFIYPTLQIYLTAAVLKAASLAGVVELVGEKAYYFAEPDMMGRIYLAGRLLTAAFAVGCVFMTYLAGARAFSERVGVTAALFLAVMPGFVVNSHYMSVDVPATFWVTVTLYAALRLYGSPETRWYLLGGAGAGLAASTKYYAVLAVASLFTAHGAGGGGRRKGLREALCDRRLLLCCLAAFCAFALTSPYVFLSFGEFLREGVMIWVDAIFLGNAVTGETRLFAMDNGNAYLDYLGSALPVGMGAGLLAAALAGLGYALYRRTGADKALLGWAVPYIVIMGLASARHVRYTVPLLPVLAIFSARLFHRLLELRRSAPWRYGLTALGAAAVFWSGAASTANVAVMAGEDNRDAAARWIADHAGDRPLTVAVAWEPDFYTPPLDRKRFRIEAVSPLDRGLDRAALERSRPELIVLSEFEYRQYIRLKSRYPVEGEFFARAVSGRLVLGGDRYEPVWFDNVPRVMGLAADGSFPPHDWLYTHPRIVVLKRRGSP